MADVLHHRGPDAAGVWLRPDRTVGLAHRRLAIRDLGPGGRQPVSSHDRRWVLVMNGEIYNADELKTSLDHARGPSPWRGRGDAEVFVEAVAHWGWAATLDRVRGMFACAVWDETNAELLLARDRAGEKPLYFSCIANSWVFASEWRGLAPFPGWQARLDPAAVAEFGRLGCIAAPRTVYVGVQQLVPGCWVALRRGCRPETVLRRRYWAFSVPAEPDADRATIAASAAAASAAAASDIWDRLRAAVAGQLAADIPVGIWLSGGLDSAAVLAAAAELGKPPPTFTVGFAESDYDESMAARATAAHFGSDHQVLTLTPELALRQVLRLATVYDEPFADSSQVATCALAEFSRRAVGVCLTGDGGDELFAGYHRHHWLPMLHNVLLSWPRSWRRLAAGLVRMASGLAHRWADAVPGPVPLPAEKLAKLAAVLAADTPVTRLALLRMAWWGRRPLLRAPREATATLAAPRSVSFAGLAALACGSEYPAPTAPPVTTAALQAADFNDYLPNDLLVKVDRAAMAVGLETRAPLLDADLIAAVNAVPVTWHAAGGRSKALLRQALSGRLPPHLLTRAKSGFAVPIGRWLRRPWREFAEQMLQERVLRDDPWIDVAAVRRLWREHVAGRRDHAAALWPVIVWRLWREKYNVLS